MELRVLEIQGQCVAHCLPSEERAFPQEGTSKDLLVSRKMTEALSCSSEAGLICPFKRGLQGPALTPDCLS